MSGYVCQRSRAAHYLVITGAKYRFVGSTVVELMDIVDMVCTQRCFVSGQDVISPYEMPIGLSINNRVICDFTE